MRMEEGSDPVAENNAAANDNQRAADNEKIKNYRLMDDVFFRAFIRDNIPAAELIFKIILQKENVKISKMETQRDMKNLKGRSSEFDFSGIVDGKPADLEIENSKEDADFHRARYHSSLLDSDSLKPGQDYTDLHDSYVVFITASDVVGYGDPYYLIERIIKGRNKDVEDGSHIIYVNGEYKGKDDIGWLMHDFNCTKPDDMHFGLLKETARFLKETKKGVAIMYKEMDELRKEGYDAGVSAGTEENKKENAAEMIRDGILTDEKIAQYAGLTIAQVKDLREQAVAMA